MDWAIWLGVALVLITVEIATVDLVAIWFALAAILLSIILAIVPIFWVWQVVLFVALSVILVLATRPLCKKFLQRKKGQETNLELIIKHTAKVVEQIDNDNEKGGVKINGLIWTARSVDGSVIDEDALVVITEIKGNKVFVRKKEEE